MMNLNGKVTMDLSEYNYLLEKATRYDNLIKVEKPYADSNTISIVVDITKIESEVRALAMREFPDMEFHTDAFDRRWNMPSSRLGEIPVEEIVEE